jgi:hypothetical protein
MANKPSYIKKDKGPSAGSRMALTPKAIRLMLAGILVMVAGYILLSGGGSKDPSVFNYDMFDWRRLVAAPIVIVCGIIIEIVAIMGRFPGNEDKE